jgi:glutathione S-transferase
MLKIWGRINSVNVKKVVWAAEECGVAYERIDAGMQYGVVSTPAYLAMNPNARVPTLDDDGFVLWESNTMVRYLARRYGQGTLDPQDLRQYADADRWMDWCTSTLAGAFRNVFWGMVRTPVEQRDAKAIETSRVETAKLLAIPEAVLAHQPYLAGAQFTMGDIPLGCFVHLWLSMPIERPAHPALSAWHARLAARPAFQKAVNTPLS